MQPFHALVAGAILAGLAVAFGAFGAHWLKSELPRRGLTVEEQRKQLDNWEVAVRYQMYHGLALILIGVLAQSIPNATILKASGWLFLIGTLIFSGCLYVLVLSGLKVLGAIVPIGGTAMIVGWVLLAIAAWRLLR